MADDSRESSLRARLSTDAVRGVRLAACAVALFVLVEPVVSILFAQGHVRVPVALRFFALDLTLAGILFVFVAAVLAGSFVAARAALRLVATAREPGWPGVLGPQPERPAEHVGAAPWFWAGALALAGYFGASFGLTLLFMKRFKEPTLIAGSLAAIQVGLILVVAVVIMLLGMAFRRGARALAPRLGPWNPLGRALPALGLLAVILIPAAAIIVKAAPQVRAVAPWRELFALLVLVVGATLGSRRFAGRPLLPDADAAKRRKVYGGAALAYLLLAALTLTKLGADPETKFLAVSGSPPLARLVDFVRVANDFDRDGYGSLLGENDCAPFNKAIHPTARDIPDNGIDENCNGRDFSIKNAPAYKSGEKMPVPAQFKRDYNVLLVTIDTVRYDHTTMGGYVKKKGRDTTPRLAELARRSVNFEFANAPSAGTMASVPAIIMSRFFHSGIHLGPERRPMPPKILPDNTTMGEMMKAVGYKTGAITTHYYFNDWGLDQGFDTYDNELGAKDDPYGIKADKTTDKAESWIAKQGSNKWFLWVHYIDPHGRYVAHPGETQYGASEEDLYDGELHWTDKNIGKLLDYLAHTPNADKTIIVVTSDHGDGFNEHGFINHGQKLYRELQNVPLIIYVPENEPVSVQGPVSNLDIFPTLADIAGSDVSKLPIEGESLVPQLFYGRDARDRVVFCETNYPDPLRAVISDQYKLVYNLKANVYELYNLKTDPWEHKNLWGSDLEGGKKMKELLDEWLDRVYYSREQGVQSQEVRKEALLAARPTPKQPTDVTAASVHVLGYDLGKPGYKPGDTVDVTLYFEATAESPTNYRLEAGATSGAAGAVPPTMRQDKVPLDGLFPTSRWKKGEFVKESYALRLPGGWPPGPIHLTFRLLDEHRQPVTLLGPGGVTIGPEATLGDLPLETPPSPEPEPAPTMQPHK